VTVNAISRKNVSPNYINYLVGGPPAMRPSLMSLPPLSLLRLLALPVMLMLSCWAQLSSQTINPALARTPRYDGYMSLVNNQSILMVSFNLTLPGGSYQCLNLSGPAYPSSFYQCGVGMQIKFSSSTTSHWPGDMQVT
jgi:hypothetical protein